MRIQGRLVLEGFTHVERTGLIPHFEQHVIKIARLGSRGFYQAQQAFS